MTDGHLHIIVKLHEIHCLQASLPQLSVKLDNIIKTQMGQGFKKYLKYESKTATSKKQPDPPAPGFISKQVHKVQEVSQLAVQTGKTCYLQTLTFTIKGR